MKYARSLARHLLALVPVLMLGIGLMGIPDSSASAAEWPADSYVLQIDGLACPYCGYGIEKQFARQRGVEGTNIDIEKGMVVVTVAPDTRFSDAELEQIVHDSGFELGAVVHRPKGR